MKCYTIVQNQWVAFIQNTVISTDDLTTGYHRIRVMSVKDKNVDRFSHEKSKREKNQGLGKPERQKLINVDKKQCQMTGKGDWGITSHAKKGTVNYKKERIDDIITGTSFLRLR